MSLPLHHISIRVPWHDSGWNGTVCQDPIANVDCLRLRNISDNKNDERQAHLAGAKWNELGDDQLPPCVRERAGFMAPFEVTKLVEHPYASWSKAHSHFKPTPLKMPAWSAPALPFRWVLASEAEAMAERHGVDLRPEYEAEAFAKIGTETNWLQDKRNQLAMFEGFFSAILPSQSLCFIYAKQVPLIEDPRRVLIGVGRVTGLGPVQEYEYSEQGLLESLIWERSVHHSIRPNFKDGLVLPYHDLFSLARDNEQIQPSALVAFAPEDHWDEFSYASELVTHDGALASLVSLSRSLRELQGIVPGDWESQLQWLDERLGEIWRLRGPSPGLGAALNAAAIPKGTLIAYELSHRLEENEDPWPLVEQVIKDPSSLPADLASGLGPVMGKIWERMPQERKTLLKLLARFDLTTDQAKRLFREEDRNEARIEASDAELIANPYLLYELDRFSPESISVRTVDRGVFPDPVVRNSHPLPEPSAIHEQFDPRRVRALVASVLESASRAGDTLLPAARVTEKVADMGLSPACDLTGDVLSVVEEDFEPTVQAVAMADKARAYQLGRLARGRDLIRQVVEKRIAGKRLEIEANWADVLAKPFPEGIGPPDTSDDAETKAREEKVAALEELAASRISVLIGPAGTGKTTLLTALVGHPQVQGGGVLLLAPTGKARVQLERRTGIPAQTIAQFLLKRDRYVFETDTYRFSASERTREAKTVVIDEASMVTEEQLAATLDALEGVERLILVGDPRQLPPIGSGRPFVDIIARLMDDEVETRFPRVASGYCELTVRRRQLGEGRDDLVLSEWFSGAKPGPGTDEIWNRLASGEKSEHLRLVTWEDERELQSEIVELVAQELELSGTDDEIGFECSYGGSEFNGWVYFRNQYGGRPGAAEKAERWQILSPVRGELYGVNALNRHIQSQFRARALQQASSTYGYRRKTPAPVGPQRILYGDKVINLRNGRYKVVFADEKRGYVANGEIGVAVGEFKDKNWRPKRPPKNIEVEYSTQLGKKYVYWPWGDAAEPPLELAYVLTVHKAQGSEFGLTLLVIPNPCRPLTRELLYTALTRQQNRVVLLHQGNIGDLRRYSDPSWSETASRLTNLFTAPSPRAFNQRFLEENLIHVTRRGELVRSKSEVIIADLLYSLDIDYAYEAPLSIGGELRLPDFTIEDADTGRTVFWEHLGMLHDPAYRRRWERKKSLYEENGILGFDEGGPSGLLVESRDDPDGGISSLELESLAGRVRDWLAG